MTGVRSRLSRLGTVIFVQSAPLVVFNVSSAFQSERSELQLQTTVFPSARSWLFARA